MPRPIVTTRKSRCRRPEELLGCGYRVHVVLYKDGQAEGTAQVAAERNVVPVQYRRGDPAAVRVVDHTWNADADAEQRHRPGLVEKGPQRCGNPTGGIDVHRVEGDGVRRPYRSVDACVDHGQVLGRHLHPDGACRRPDQADQGRPPPTAGRSVVAFLHHAQFEQPLHDLGDGRWAELELASQVGPGHRAGAAQQSQDRSLGEVACECGRLGCLEAYVSDHALLDRAHQHGGRYARLDMAGFVSYVADGDARMVDLYLDVIRRLGVAVANLVNLLSPESVVLGGEAAYLTEQFVADVRTEAAQHTFGGLPPSFTLDIDDWRNDPAKNIPSPTAACRRGTSCPGSGPGAARSPTRT
jgi:hypothetical protein